MIPALACALIAFAVYLRTLAPTVYTFDSAEFATGAYVLGIIHSTGYPFYLVLAKLFTYLPVGDVAYRVNLMSAVWAAVTIGLLFVLCERLTHRPAVGAGAALFYAFSHYFWPQAVIAETYTLNTTLVLALILLLFSWKDSSKAQTAALAGLALGLGFANHMSIILMVPAVIYWGILHRPRPKAFVAFAACIGAGLLFYLYFPIRYAADPPLNYARTYFATDLTTPRGIYSWVTGEMFRQFMAGYSPVEIIGEMVQYLYWLWSNFIGAGVLVGIVGIVAMLRRDVRLFIFFALMYAGYTGFYINYRVVNKETMFNVSYLIWTVWLAYGAREIHDWLSTSLAEHPVPWLRRARTLLAPALLALLVLVSLVVNYAWADQSHNRMASDFAGELMRDVGPSALIVTEWTWATPLEYLQIVEGRRPDVIIFDRGLAGLAVWNALRREGVPDAAAVDRIEVAISERIAAEMAHRPVYATAFDEILAREFLFTPQSNYYRLEPRAAAGTTP